MGKDNMNLLLNSIFFFFLKLNLTMSQSYFLKLPQTKHYLHEYDMSTVTQRTL